MKVKGYKEDLLPCPLVLFLSFCPFVKYVFTASSFQALANHWQNKDGKARNRE